MNDFLAVKIMKYKWESIIDKIYCRFSDDKFWGKNRQNRASTPWEISSLQPKIGSSKKIEL